MFPYPSSKNYQLIQSRVVSTPHSRALGDFEAKHRQGVFTVFLVCLDEITVRGAAEDCLGSAGRFEYAERSLLLLGPLPGAGTSTGFI